MSLTLDTFSIFPILPPPTTGTAEFSVLCGLKPASCIQMDRTCIWELVAEVKALKWKCSCSYNSAAKNSKVYISVKAIHQYYGEQSKALYTTLRLQYTLVINVGKYTFLHLVWLPLYNMW